MIILFLIIQLSLLTIILSFYYSKNSGGTDLRNRIVGARLIGKGYSPYFHKWQPSDGEFLLDPNDSPTRLANGNTVTPAVFYISYPLINLPYPRIRLFWTIIQHIAALLLISLMLKRYEGSSRLIPAAIVILGVFTSNYWLFHVERGQMSIFYALLFAIMYYLFTSKRKYGEYLSGMIGGLFVLLRPFAAVVFIGFLIKGKTKWLFGFITGAIIGLILFVAPNFHLWDEYFKVINEYGNECQNKGHTIQNAPVYIRPTVIEGASNLKKIQSFDTVVLPALNGYIRKLGIDYTFFLSVFTCGTILLIISVGFYRLKNRSSPVDLFLFSFLCYIIVQLFTLNWRGPYIVLEWSFPLFLIVQRVHYRSSLYAILIISLMFLHGFPFYFRYQNLFSEPLLILIIMHLIFINGIESAQTSKKSEILPGTLKKHVN
jgi:hypothetical protein